MKAGLPTIDTTRKEPNSCVPVAGLREKEMAVGSASTRLLAGALLLSSCLPISHAEAYSLETLYGFCSANKCADGSHPNDLVIDAAGNIYGTTEFSGAGHFGVVFQY